MMDHGNQPCGSRRLPPYSRADLKHLAADRLCLLLRLGAGQLLQEDQQFYRREVKRRLKRRFLAEPHLRVAHQTLGSRRISANAATDASSKRNTRKDTVLAVDHTVVNANVAIKVGGVGALSYVQPLRISRVQSLAKCARVSTDARRM